MFDFLFYRSYNKSIQIDFDPGKDAINQAKHGVSLAQARLLAWDEALEWEDDRRDYGERCICCLAPIGERLYYVAYVDRGPVRRIVSLRKANIREVNKYVDAT